MGKFLTYLAAILIVILGLPNIAFCISYINDKTLVRGSPNQLEKEEFTGEYGYKIQYNLNDGILPEENKTVYGMFTPTFTLNNPEKTGYEFLGWTGSNGETPQIRITICMGSSGDLEFTANFALILEAPTTQINNNIISWNAIKNADYYTINVNGIDRCETENLEYNLLELKEYYIAGNNIIKVKSSTRSGEGKFFSSDYSSGVVYSLNKLDTPVITINDFIISWDAVSYAYNYQVLIGGFEVITSECNVNLLNYLSYISSSGVTQIRVRALSNSEDIIINSDFSQVKEFITPMLNEVDLDQNNDNTLSWNYDENVEYYELYLNYNLCKKIVGLNQIDIMLFATDMKTGDNYFQIHAYAAGYKKSVSNYVVYRFTNISELEGMILETDFYRYSDSFEIRSGSYIDYIQSNDLSFYLDGRWKDQDSYHPYEPYWDDYGNDIALRGLNYMLDFNRDLYILDFVNANTSNERMTAMFNIFNIINDNYINDRQTATINLSGLLRFKIKSTGKYYIPNNILIKIHYIDMFTVTTFKENSHSYLSDFSSNHRLSTSYTIIQNSTKVDYSSVNISLELTNGNIVNFGYNTYNGYHISTGSNTYYSRAEFINVLSQNKFKLSDGYYFTINAADLVDAIKNEADKKVPDYIVSSTWNGESLENLNINNLINVYYENGTEVEFNYSLNVKYYLFTIY